MFQSAIFKLTVWYVVALCFVCLLFSVPAYNVASERLRRGAERQTEVIRRLPGLNLGPQLEMQREQQLEEDRSQLLQAFFIFNTMIVISGSVASYLFARRTLAPIERAHRAQARFTADASHELRTPLATMKAEIDVLLRSKSISIKDAKQILTSNLEEIARLQQLSEQLLMLTRLESSTDSFVRFDFAQVLKDEVRRIEKQNTQPIQLHAVKHAYLFGDSALLRQVSSILIMNALNYSPVNDKQVVVTITSHKQVIRLAVTNNGHPISSKDQEKVFDRFYRGRNAIEHNRTGHGLGLSLAKRIVEAHSGSIGLVSNDKVGTVFTVELPKG